MSEKITKLIEDVKTLTVLELSELVKALENEFGVSASAPTVVAAGPAESSVPVSEQTEFDVILSEIGPSKLAIIKLVREVTGLGLKDAKDVVESIPKPIKEKISKEAAEDMKKKFEEHGAKVQLK
ncbi:MAG: 50S ribosomal protein L7/L12 [Firmicutes bacterium]|nr:50S ribosomal protein L7/L12 [Bacillota bacterium]